MTQSNKTTSESPIARSGFVARVGGWCLVGAAILTSAAIVFAQGSDVSDPTSQRDIAPEVQTHVADLTIGAATGNGPVALAAAVNAPAEAESTETVSLLEFACPVEGQRVALAADALWQDASDAGLGNAFGMDNMARLLQAHCEI